MENEGQEIIETLIKYLLDPSRATPLGNYIKGSANPDEEPTGYPYVTVLAGDEEYGPGGQVTQQFTIELTVSNESTTGPQEEFLEVMKALRSAVIHFDETKAKAFRIEPTGSQVISGRTEKGVLYMGLISLTARYTIDVWEYDNAS